MPAGAWYWYGRCARSGLTPPTGAPDIAGRQIHLRHYAGGKVGLEHSAIANFAELQALMPPNQSVHDRLPNLGHGDVFAITHVPPGHLHAEGFLFS